MTTSHAPIAYTYEADWHCETCAHARFGCDYAGYIVGTDREDNEVGAVAPWEEWWQPWSLVDGDEQSIACGTCGATIATVSRLDWS